MGKIAYVPFDEGGLLSFVEITISTFNQGRIFDRFEKPIRVHKDSGEGALKGVSAGTQVYIFGHGAPQSDTIEANNGAALTLEQLAKQLKADGLKLNHKTIKLNACNGGTGDLNSMAVKLLMAMHGEGFTNVTVYGYTESLMVQSEGSKKRGESGARAKDIRVGWKMT